MSWKKLLFKDFITLQRGFDLPKTQMKEGEVPVLGSNCIIGYHNEAKVAPQGVVTGRSGTLGVVQFIEKDFWPHNTALWVKDFKGNIPRFVYYKLQTLHLENFNGGASVPTLNRNVLDTLPVNVPDIDTQSKIATTLSNYDDLIENNRRRIQLLERSLHLLYKEWFVHLRFPSHEHSKIVDGIPEGWKKLSLSHFCAEIKVSINPKEIPSETPYIGLEHIPRRSVTLSDWGTAAEVDSQKFAFKAGDILFGKIRPYFHKVGFTLTDGIASSDAVVIRPTEPRFYCYCLLLVSSDEFISLASKTMREGSKMPRADWKYLSTCEFLIPPSEILYSFNEVCFKVINQLQNLALQNRQLQQARDLLLPKLMSGAISV